MTFVASDIAFTDLPSGTDQDVDVVLNIGSPEDDGVVWLGIGFRNNQGHSITQVTMDPAGEAIAMTAGIANAGFLYARAFRADPGGLSGDVTFRVRVTGGANTAFQVPVAIDVWDGLDLSSHEEATGEGGSIAGSPPLSTQEVGASATGRTCFAFHFTRNASTPPADATFTMRESSSNGDNFYAVIGDLVSDADPEALDVEWAGAAGNWQSVGASFAPAGGGGSTYTQSIAGAVTPAGTLTKRKSQTLVSSSSPAGALVRAPRKGLTGTVSPSATVVKRADRVFSGAIAPSGIARRSPRKEVAGSVASSATLDAVRALLRSVTGTVTPAGAVVRQAGRLAAGAVTPSGVLQRQAGKTAAGTIAPAATLAKGTAKVLGGSVAPTGGLSALRSYLRSVAGTVAPSGALTPLAILARAFAGALTLAGTVSKRSAKTLGGTVAPTGATTRAVWKQVDGTLQLAGVVSTAPRKRFEATLPLVGVTVTVAGTFAQPGPHPLRIRFAGHGKSITFVVHGKRIRLEPHSKSITFEQ